MSCRIARTVQIVVPFDIAAELWKVRTTTFIAPIWYKMKKIGFFISHRFLISHSFLFHIFDTGLKWFFNWKWNTLVSFGGASSFFGKNKKKIQLLKSWFSSSESILLRKCLKCVLTFLNPAPSLHKEVIWICALNFTRVVKEEMGTRRGWCWPWQKLWHSRVLLAVTQPDSCSEFLSRGTLLSFSITLSH